MKIFRTKIVRKLIIVTCVEKDILGFSTGTFAWTNWVFADISFVLNSDLAGKADEVNSFCLWTFWKRFNFMIRCISFGVPAFAQIAKPISIIVFNFRCILHSLGFGKDFFVSKWNFMFFAILSYNRPITYITFHFDFTLLFLFSICLIFRNQMVIIISGKL